MSYKVTPKEGAERGPNTLITFDAVALAKSLGVLIGKHLSELPDNHPARKRIYERYAEISGPLSETERGRLVLAALGPPPGFEEYERTSHGTGNS